MKTVIFTSPYLDVAEFPDARISLRSNVPIQVTDDQAAILLSNPDVTIAASAASPAPAAIVDVKPAVKAAIAKASTPSAPAPTDEVN